MRAFFIGLITLIAVVILSGIGLLLYPLVIVLAFFLRILIAIFFVIFCIWLLGKFIMYIWGMLFKSKQPPVKSS